MARKFQIDTPAQIGGLLELLAGLSVTGAVTVTDTLTITNGISGALILGAQASAVNHAVRAGRLISTGSGLTGGGDLTADRTLSVSFGGNGVATTVARSDHDHSAAYLGISAKAADSDKLDGLDSLSFMRADANTSTTGSLQVGTTLTVNGAGTVTGLLSLGTQATGTGHAVRADRSISTGTGLTGGGNLTADRTLTVDFGTGSNQVARGNHLHSEYLPIATGGTISGDLTIYKSSPKLTLGVDAPVGTGNISIVAQFQLFNKGELRYDTTSFTWKVSNDYTNYYDIIHAGGGQTIGGALTVTGSITEGGTALSAKYASTGTSISAGTGLTGGGTLASTRTLSVDFGTGTNQAARGDHLHDTRYAQLASTNTFTGDQVISKNSGSLSFVRPSGQTGQYTGIATKDDTAWKGFLYWDFTGSKWVLSPNGGTNYYDILHSGGGQTINGTLTTTGAITEAGTSLASKYASTATSISAGTGLTGGGTLAANRTLSVDFGTGATQVAAGNHNHDSVYSKLSGGQTWSGNITFDTTAVERSVRFLHQTGKEVGVYAQPNLFGIYDWGNTRDVFRYVPGSNSVTVGPPTTFSGAVTMSSTLSTSGAITEAGTALSAKYASLSGATFTGGITGTTASFSTSITEAGTALASKYAAIGHNHDSVYSAIGHNHDGTYMKRGDANATLTDANALTTSGFYNTSSSFTGSPAGGVDGSNQGYLESYTWSNSSYVLQVHTPVNQILGRRYRIKDNGTWGSWITQLDSSIHNSTGDPHTQYALRARSISAGSGLSGGGTLASDISFSIGTGAVTDTHLGNRTVDQAIAAATANTGTLTQLLSWIVKEIKAIKGTTNWYDSVANALSAMATKTYVDTEVAKAKTYAP